MELKSSISQAPLRPRKHGSLLLSARTECEEFFWSSSLSLCPEPSPDGFKKLWDLETWMSGGLGSAGDSMGSEGFSKLNSPRTGTLQAGTALGDAWPGLPAWAGAGGLRCSGLGHRPPLMCFTHVMNIEGICFLKPVLIEIAQKAPHARGLPVSYYYFFHFGARLCFLGKQEKQQGKKALFVSLAWSSILERFPGVEMMEQQHRGIRGSCWW